LSYAVYFANKDTATAPAQQVSITDQLDTAKDNLVTLSLGPIAVGNQLISPPPLQTDFASTIDLRPATSLLVAVHGNLNPSTGLLTWNFQSLDPSTNQPPVDPTVGFLPPGAEGSVFFTVSPKQGLATNTQIANQASIVFDTNTPISTPTWMNTIDNTAPTSHIVALPSIESSLNFVVQWTGTDVGAGIQDFTVYVSDGGGPFTAFQTNTAATSATFSGQAGHTYAFYSIARDLVGNVEAAKTVAEAIDAEGWFHTGDIGELDADGYLKITDRKKDLIKTAGGKFVAPQPIENLIKLNKFVANAVVLGDKRKFPIVLVVPNYEALERWAGERNLSYGSHAQLLALADVRAKIEREVMGMLRDLAKFEMPKKVVLIENDFTIESGELTPTLKVKRRAVEKRYAELIDKTYAEADPMAAAVEG